MANTRQQVVATMGALLEAQGYHATGLNQVVVESGSPKGSLYYYFPDGKEGLAVEAIERLAVEIEARIRGRLAEAATVGDGVQALLGVIATYMERSAYRTGGPITMVAMETAATSERLSRACSDAFERWRRAFQDRIELQGYAAARAESLSTLVMAALEGAVLLSRTHHDTAPLRRVGQELLALLDGPEIE